VVWETSDTVRMRAADRGGRHRRDQDSEYYEPGYRPTDRPMSVGPGTGAMRTVLESWRRPEESTRSASGPVPQVPEHPYAPLTFDGDDADTVMFPALREHVDPGRDALEHVVSEHIDTESRAALVDIPLSDHDMASATEFPEPVHTSARGIAAWWRHSGLLLGRQVKVWLRDPATLVQSIVFPGLSMIMFKVVLGDTIGQATGQNSAYSTVPLVILVGAMFGGMATSVRLSVERRTGLLARLYVMPIHRGSDLTSRIVAELMRILLTSVVLVAAGFLIGFRFTQGPWAALGILGVPLLYGAAFSIMTLALAVNSSRIPLVPILSLLCSLLMFFNSGFAPLDSYPTWLQGVVKYQPMSCAIEVMRSLAAGGPITENLIRTAIWAGGMLLIFTVPALIGYRRAATARD